ncbi:cell division protein FtsX [Phyllobacterium myrsinacearum]|uniref:ABC transporter permease n=1 Tax=Phyllobacterium myrsinacearum TaxID=28101 RepID=A0A2S9JKC1_9HYPH|nr:ABC transporter permease [Phyllobacterium myrsinacearum]PRD53524.1 ABC transporter permease [Phyllobacterium myrsinacearum]PWV86981.1 cell division transport system permease protein [Phyllobacterium myrsinacearum]RZV07985.1 cell division transport system permease protein [Phyllobacterium myrsinacearum]
MIDAARLRELAADLTDRAIQLVRGRSGQAPIVPAGNVVGHALMIVIAIMTFLACLTIGAVSLVQSTAATWQSQISTEATIQIRPVEGQDMEALLVQAGKLAQGFAGVKSTRVIDRAATARLLEPWLGTGLNIDELPVPRLVVVTLDEASPPDFALLRSELVKNIPGASFDDHRTWVDRLVSMARSTVLIGMTVLGLVIAATILTVIFATRGAMAGNGHIIEVLHFIGAEQKFVARQFERHFFWTALKGALCGGALAILIFLIIGWWSSRNLATPEADQATALFGNFSIGSGGYTGVVLIILAVSVLTMITTRMTVIAHLRQVDGRAGDSHDA